MTEEYEPDFWSHLIAQVQFGDIVADVGAFIGLYTIALAKRVGPSGKVVAFEPDPENFTTLQKHVDLNNVSDRVELIQAGVCAQDGAVPFESGMGSGSHISFVKATNSTQMVRCVRLDTIFANSNVDILKIDVEGYEEGVLQGGINLLSDGKRSPRVIYIEVHPYSWKAVGTSSESLLNLLGRCNYRVYCLDGQSVKQIKSWSKIVAYKNNNHKKEGKPKI
jgi:FkbM family methyltransferase